MKQTFHLAKAHTRLEAFLNNPGEREGGPTPLRAFLDVTRSKLLSAGVLQYGDVTIWHSLTGQRDAQAPDRVTFELELSTDMEVPEALVVSCAIGRSHVRHRVHSATRLAWTAALADVQNPRNKRVDAIAISLEIVPADQTRPSD
jgi:hypothetical protein